MRVTGLAAAFAFALLTCVGCNRRAAPTEHAKVADSGALGKPADHLAKDELVVAKSEVLGLPLPRGFVVLDSPAGEGMAAGEATLDELRRHVLEHTMNCLARPEGDALVWWDCEMPAQGAKKFHVRAEALEGVRTLLVVRAQEPAPAIEGGSGEVLKRLGIEANGYPVGYDKLR